MKRITRVKGIDPSHLKRRFFKDRETGGTERKACFLSFDHLVRVVTVKYKKYA